MSNENLVQPNGKAISIKKTFSRTTAVAIDIQADSAIIWALLTNAGDFARWNSTIVSLEGEIALGNTIKLRSTLDPKRVFKIKVKEVVPEKKMVWGDAMGNRNYTLEQINSATTRFTMHEKMGGPFFPLFAGFIPPFEESFEQYAADLKKEAETIQKEK